LQAFFDTHGPFDGVIHFAAFKAVGESVREPLKYFRNNIGSTVNLLDAMRQAGCDKLVFSSSCTVYGNPDTLPVNEDAPIKPALSPYGSTKQINEEIIRDLAIFGQLQAILLRYFNPIGAHASARIGELPLGEPNNLVPYITQTAAGIRPQLTVFGDDYQTPDGTCQRDYIHVSDLAQAHVLALSRLAEHKNEDAVEVFNLGTGKPYSVLEVIRSFEKISGLKLNVRVSARRAGDVDKVWADTERARRLLGWTARRDLDEMMRSAWAWEMTMKHHNEQQK
jgi:UDP-glucose 4-epimerase